MKRLALILGVASLLSFFVIQPARAATFITLSAPGTRTLGDKFINDDLAMSLGYDGALGKFIFAPTPGARIWAIDPLLIDEVSAMANGYKLESNTVGEGVTVAQIWLARLKAVTRHDDILALPYGSPSGYWIHRLDPHDESYFLGVGAEKLQNFFGRPVSTSTTYANKSWFKLPTDVIYTFAGAVRTLQATGSFINAADLEKFHLRIANILNPAMDKSRRTLLAADIDQTMGSLNRKIRLAQSKFTVTSQHQKLPITVINDFDNQGVIKLEVEALNSKVEVATLPQTITVAGKSKLQVFIPITVITSGQSTIRVTLKNNQGSALGDPVLYRLSLSVISPIATWFTSIAALLLFAGALIQSFRRLRKKRAGENE